MFVSGWSSENIMPTSPISLAEYEKRKGSQVARHHIKDHRAKQLLVVPNDDKFVAVAAPEAFSRHSGTCMILGGQVWRRGSFLLLAGATDAPPTLWILRSTIFISQMFKFVLSEAMLML